MSLAAKLKKSVLRLARKARAVGKQGREAIALLKVDPAKHKRTSEECEKIAQFLRRLPFFRRTGIVSDRLRDFCTYGVARQFLDGDTVLAMGEPSVFLVVLSGKANVMMRTNAKVPARVLFEGDAENEGYLNQVIRSVQVSPVSILAAKDGTVVLQMSDAWLEATDFLRVCRLVNIDFRDPVYDRGTFLGRIPAKSLKRLLRRSRIQAFSAHKIVLHATGQSKDNSTLASLTSQAQHDVMYIAQGTVQVKWVFRDGDSTWYIPVATFGEREVVGLLEALYDLPVSYQVVATSPVKVLVIPTEALAQMRPADLKPAEHLCFEQWLSWVDRLLRVLHACNDHKSGAQDALSKFQAELESTSQNSAANKSDGSSLETHKKVGIILLAFVRAGKHDRMLFSRQCWPRALALTVCMYVYLQERGFAFNRKNASTMYRQIDSIKAFLVRTAVRFVVAACV